MQVSTETTQGLERRITVTIPGTDVAQELQNRLTSLAQTTRIAGFRPGKIPQKVIQQRFGDQVRRDVLGERMRATLNEVLTQQNWRVASNPRFEVVSGWDPSVVQDVCYTATFEIYPEVVLAPVEAAVISRPEIQIGDSDVDAMVDHLRRQRQIWSKVDRPAAIDDRVTIDFTGFLADGTKFPGGSGTDVLLVLGSGRFVGEFEQRLVGAVVAETRMIDVVFPADYGHADLAGQAVQFSVVVKAIEAGHLPELDELFIRTLGVADGTEESFRREVRLGMERDCAGKVRELVKAQLLDWLYQNNPVELPNALVQEELVSLRSRDSTADVPGQALEERARRHVALGILLGDVVRRQRIKPDPEQVRAYIRAAADEYESPEQVEQWYAADSKRLQEIEAVVVEDMALEWILKQVQLKPVSVPLRELLNPELVSHA